MKRRLYIILTAVPEVLGCAVIGAWRGATDGARNVLDAWDMNDRRVCTVCGNLHTPKEQCDLR